MTIQEYCANEKCALIKMRYEYILIYEDKYVFSHVNKDNKVDFKTIHNWRLISLIVVLPIFMFFVTFLTWKTIGNSYFWIFALICLFISIVGFFRLLFFETSTSVIQKEKIINIFTATKWVNWINIDDNIYIKYKDENDRTKIRKILLPIDKIERESAIQLLREYNICDIK